MDEGVDAKEAEDLSGVAGLGEGRDAGAAVGGIVVLFSEEGVTALGGRTPRGLPTEGGDSGS